MELDSLPVEVKHEILETGDSIELLKTCRFLSKSWNEICCRILRKVSAVPLSEFWDGEEDLEDFKDVILDRHDLMPAGWPNPFHNLSILNATFSKSSLVRYLERPNLRITTLEAVHDETLNIPNFERFLDLHKGSIIHLKIRGKTKGAPFLTLSKMLGSGWRALKSVTLVDSCEGLERPCAHVDFIIELTGRNRIKRLDLQSKFQNTTRIFAGNRDCWDNLKYLGLRSLMPPVTANLEQLNELMCWMQEIKFPSLTGLVVWFPYDGKAEQTSEQLTPYILPLIQGNSAVLEELRVCCISLNVLPNCPKLRVLDCALMDGDRIHDFTELRFPSLTSVYAILRWRQVPLYTDPKNVLKHRKIICSKVFWARDPTNKEAQETVWPSLRDHFPGLRTLIVQPKIDSNCLSVIQKRLPRLEKLTITEAYPNDLLGSWCGPAATANGWPREDTENSALLDMAELTHLTLDSWLSISREVIIGVLGRLPTVRFLSFHWNNVLEVSDVPKYLGHIQSVTIIYKDNSQKRVLEELAKRMKNLNLKRIISDDYI